jgi:hypothetical protein
MSSLEDRVLKILPKGNPQGYLNYILHHGGLRTYTGELFWTDISEDLPASAILEAQISEVLGLDYRVGTRFVGDEIEWSIEIGERHSKGKNFDVWQGEDEGIPPCCIKSYVKRQHSKRFRYWDQLLAGKSKEELREKHMHLAYANFYLCRINCVSAKELLTKYMQYTQTNFPRIAKRIESGFLRELARKEI